MIAIANTDNMVLPEDGCPSCGEQDADFLVWLDAPQDDHVECQRCGMVFQPAAGSDDQD